jgi:AraC-like DNA-binding protein
MFRRGPVGHYAIGEHLLMWCTRPDLCGLVLWGHASADEIALLAHVFDHGEHTGIATPCDFILDARRLTGVDGDPVEAFVTHAQARLADLLRRVRRHALVRPSGLYGAVVAGFYDLLDAEFPRRIFAEHEPALAWLDEPEPARLTGELDRLVGDALETSPVSHLRAWLEADDRGPVRLDVAAQALSMSPRSLQRRLREAGTSFRAEVDEVRVERARRLLAETDLKVGAIARQLGFSSETTFISVFRRRTGSTPGEWRRAGRKDCR